MLSQGLVFKLGTFKVVAQHLVKSTTLPLNAFFHDFLFEDLEGRLPIERLPRSFI